MKIKSESELKNTWTRKQTRIAVEVSEMEQEIKRMKDKGISSQFIEAKNQRINLFLDIINFADDYIAQLRHTLLKERLNIIALQKLHSDLVNSSSQEFLDFLKSDTQKQAEQSTNEIKQDSNT